MATVLNDGETIQSHLDGETIQSHLDEEDALFEAIEKLITQGMINARDVEGLQEAGIRNFTGLMNHISENPSGVAGISKAKLDQICQTSEIILERKAENKWKTTNIIEKKALMGRYLKLKKRIQTLLASIALNNEGGGTCSQGQMEHWERELLSWQKKVANIEQNNF